MILHQPTPNRAAARQQLVELLAARLVREWLAAKRPPAAVRSNAKLTGPSENHRSDDGQD